MNPKLKESITRLPREPGAYLMKNDKGTIIYVGKAKNLRSRVASYFGAGGQSSLKTKSLVSHIHDVEVIITKTEVEALLLERTLIKHHKPRYNILLRDDKEYPYLRIDFNEPWPRIEKVRRRKDDGATYLGPFGSASKLKLLIDAVGRIFPLIRCSRYQFASAKRPCNYYHMKMCLGPCVLEVDRNEYVEMLHDAVAFLNGQNKELVRSLKHKMHQAAAQELFELAAKIRDQLQALESITERQAVVVGEVDEADAIGFDQNETRTSFHILMVRDRLMIGSDGFLLGSAVESPEQAMTEFLLQYYDSRSLPRELLLPFAIEDADELRTALLQDHPDVTRLELRVPARGPRHDLVLMAEKNASYRLEQSLRSLEQSRVEIEVLRDKLGLDRTPVRMECIDISNIQGTAIVASDVCFMNGKPAKDLYRHYTIRDVTGGGPDDFESIREVVRRRLTRGLRDQDLPDLLVIDGGKGQLSSAMSVYHEFKEHHPGLDMEIISLAKSRLEKRRKDAFMNTGNPERSFERVFFPGREVATPLAPGTPEFRLLTRIRDEAHRFAITHHRKVRSRLSQSSPLEEIPGIGPAMRRKLLETFGSIEGLKKASLDDLKAVKGLRESSAVALYSGFRSDEDECNDSDTKTRTTYQYNEN